MNRSYRDLLVWQKAMDLVVECYSRTRQFPKVEAFGLASQLQRAAVSVPSNIAEGCERGSKREFLHHLYIAAGSLAEVETQIEIALRLNYISADDCQQLLSKSAEIGKMLSVLKKSLNSQISSNH